MATNSQSNLTTVPKPTTLVGHIVTQAIAIVAFVLVPIAITLMAPLTTLEFRHSEAGTSVTAVRYLLMYIPWKTDRMVNATSVEADITAAKDIKRNREERRRRKPGIQFATGRLIFISGAPEIEMVVDTDPELAKQVVKQFDEFAANKTAAPITIQIYAAWIISYVVGGVASAFCALYVIGASLAIVTFPFKLLRAKRTN